MGDGPAQATLTVWVEERLTIQKQVTVQYDPAHSEELEALVSEVFSSGLIVALRDYELKDSEGVQVDLAKLPDHEEDGDAELHSCRS